MFILLELCYLQCHDSMGLLALTNHKADNEY